MNLDTSILRPTSGLLLAVGLYLAGAPVGGRVAGAGGGQVSPDAPYLCRGYKILLAAPETLYLDKAEHRSLDAFLSEITDKLGAVRTEDGHRLEAVNTKPGIEIKASLKLEVLEHPNITFCNFELLLEERMWFEPVWQSAAAASLAQSTRYSGDSLASACHKARQALEDRQGDIVQSILKRIIELHGANRAGVSLKPGPPQEGRGDSALLLVFEGEMVSSSAWPTVEAPATVRCLEPGYEIRGHLLSGGRPVSSFNVVASDWINDDYNTQLVVWADLPFAPAEDGSRPPRSLLAEPEPVAKTSEQEMNSDLVREGSKKETLSFRPIPQPEAPPPFEPDLEDEESDSLPVPHPSMPDLEVGKDILDNPEPIVETTDDRDPKLPAGWVVVVGCLLVSFPVSVWWARYRYRLDAGKEAEVLGEGSVSSHYFISHNHREAAAARQLATALEALGFSVWCSACSGTVVKGKPYRPQVDEALASAVGMFLLLGAEPVDGWVEAELDCAIERAAADPSFRLVPVPLFAHSLDLSPPLARRFQAMSVFENGDLIKDKLGEETTNFLPD